MSNYVVTTRERYVMDGMWQDDTVHAVEMVDWHNNPPSEFFAESDREGYARQWLHRLSMCGLLGDRQNYLRVMTLPPSPRIEKKS